MRRSAGGAPHSGHRHAPPVAKGGYTSGMPSSPPEPTDRTPPLPEGERFGPLLVQRLVKADGRALILFTRVAEADEAE
jgi:hypothetical protein